MLRNLLAAVLLALAVWAYVATGSWRASDMAPAPPSDDVRLAERSVSRDCTLCIERLLSP